MVQVIVWFFGLTCDQKMLYPCWSGSEDDVLTLATVKKKFGSNYRSRFAPICTIYAILATHEWPRTLPALKHASNHSVSSQHVQVLLGILVRTTPPFLLVRPVACVRENPIQLVNVIRSVLHFMCSSRSNQQMASLKDIIMVSSACDRKMFLPLMNLRLKCSRANFMVQSRIRSGIVDPLIILDYRLWRLLKQTIMNLWHFGNGSMLIGRW